MCTVFTFFTEVYIDMKTKNKYFAYVHPIHSIIPYKNFTENIGVCIIMCRTNTFQKIVDDISLPVGTIFTIIDNKNNIIASNIKESSESYLNDIIHMLQKYKYTIT